MRRVVVIAMVAVGVGLAGAVIGGQQGQPASVRAQDTVQLERAISLEVMDGNLKAAMEIYRQLSVSADRAVAARALLRLGDAYRKQGDPQARDAYERVLREFGDEPAAADARARVGTSQAGKRAESVWAGPNVSNAGHASADGRYVPFTENTGDLAVRDLVAGTNVRLTTVGEKRAFEEFAQDSVASRDGKRIAYTWWLNAGNDNELRVIDRTVPAPQPTSFRIPDAAYARVMDWGPAGDWLMVQVTRHDGSSQLGILSLASGRFQSLKSVDWRGAIRLAVSPDGAYVAYDLPAGEHTSLRDVFVLRRDGSRPELKVTDKPGRVAVVGWTPDGASLLYSLERTGTVGLMAVSINEGMPQGSVRVIESDLGTFYDTLAVTTGGRLLFTKKISGPNVFTATMDFAAGGVRGKPEHVTDSVVLNHTGPMWSPDGKALAYTASGRGTTSVMIRSIETGQTRELIPEVNSLQFPSWSTPAFITFQGSDRKGRQGIFRLDVQTGEATLLVGGDDSGYRSFGDVTPDGNTLVYGQNRSGTVTLMVRDLATGQERQLAKGPATATQVSPDGQWVAYRSGNAEGQSIMVVPLAGGTPRALLTAKNVAHFVEWMPDSHGLLARSNGALVTLRLDGTARGEVSLPGDFIGPAFRVRPDGRRVAYSEGVPAFEIWSLENFLPTSGRAAK
jgi:Tol biopolymer transport system component